MNREEAEKKVPKTYEEAMEDAKVADFINIISLWGKLIDLGYVKDFDEVQEYQKEIYEKALREQIIKKLTEEE